MPPVKRTPTMKAAVGKSLGRSAKPTTRGSHRFGNVFTDLTYSFTGAGNATPALTQKVDDFVRRQREMLEYVEKHYPTKEGGDTAIVMSSDRVEEELGLIAALKATPWRGYKTRLKRHLRYLYGNIRVLKWYIDRVDSERRLGEDMKEWVMDFERETIDDLLVDMSVAFPGATKDELVRQYFDWRLRSAHRFMAPPRREQRTVPLVEKEVDVGNESQD